MSNQTKIGLLLGLGVILLVGIIISDHLATQSQNHITESGPVVSRLYDGNPTNQPTGLRNEILIPAPLSTSEVALANPSTTSNQLPPVALGGGFSSPPSAMATGPLVPPVAPAQIPTPLTANPQHPAQQAAIVAPPAAPAPAKRTYTIKDKDTLSSIAAATLGSRNRWKEILDANKQTLDAGKNLKIGAVLVIPESAAKPAPAPTPTPAAAPAAKPAPRTYTVAKGDLLGSIAAKTLGSAKHVKELVDANKKILPQGEKTMLHTGMVLAIPAQ